MLAKVFSGAVVGLDSTLIEAEIDISSQGLPAFNIVGLPDKAVEEARERVRSALKNSGFDFPAKRITVNLAPADLPKEGSSYDLPIAVGILLASGQIKADISDSIFTGELSLNGNLKYTTAILPIAIMAKDKQFSNLFLPKINSSEAAIINNLNIFPVENLIALVKHLTSESLIEIETTKSLDSFIKNDSFDFDMKDVYGQEQAKRAMEIAAAGSHNILLKGPPGAGKTLLARTMPSILPKLTLEEALEVTKIYSISGLLDSDPIITKRPFRAPHHTTSHIGLIGGGANPKPGEISLAHRGVLFLDEFPEFPRHVLEALRQPLEDGLVAISRASRRIIYPSKFLLFAAQNPCPCGYFGDITHNCTCNLSQINRYQKRISGPMLDRIDIHLEIPAVKVEKLTANEKNNSESSLSIRKRVQQAKDIQTKRFANLKITSNSEMGNKEIKKFCLLNNECLNLLKMAVSKMNLSARSYQRVIKLSRTIADLEKSTDIKPGHIAESLQYRIKTDSSISSY